MGVGRIHKLAINCQTNTHLNLATCLVIEYHLRILAAYIFYVHNITTRVKETLDVSLKSTNQQHR